MQSTLEPSMMGGVDQVSQERERLECALTPMKKGTGPSRSLISEFKMYKSCILPSELD